MGRSRRNRPLEKALAQALAVGISEGRVATITAIIESAAAAIIVSEYAQITSTVSSGGLVAATEALRRAAGVAWHAAWRVALSAPLFALMQNAPVPTDKGMARLPFDRAENNMFFNEYMNTLSEQLTSTGRDKIGAILDEAQSSGYSVEETAWRLRDEMLVTSEGRARVIAADQVLKATKAAANEKARLSGAVGEKSRHDSNDSRVRDSHERWDGERVGIDELYSSGEVFPGQLEPMCRCREIFHIGNPELPGGVA